MKPREARTSALICVRGKSGRRLGKVTLIGTEDCVWVSRVGVNVVGGVWWIFGAFTHFPRGRVGRDGFRGKSKAAERAETRRRRLGSLRRYLIPPGMMWARARPLGVLGF